MILSIPRLGGHVVLGDITYRRWMRNESLYKYSSRLGNAEMSIKL